MGILTIGVVTKPFAFEGKVRMNNAVNGILNLKNNVDTLITIPNDRLLDTVGNVSLAEAFRIADDVLQPGHPGYQRPDRGTGYDQSGLCGRAHHHAGAGHGPYGHRHRHRDKRASEAARQAVISPLLETTINGRQGRSAQYHRRQRFGYP